MNLIDTMKLQTTKELSESAIRKMEEWGKSNIYGNGRIKGKYNHFQYMLLNDRNMPMVKYTKENRKLTVEVPSCPFFLNGNSLLKIRNNDKSPLLEKLKSLLREDLNIDASNLEHWRVINMDMYYDFSLGIDLPDYIHAMREIVINNYDRKEINNQTLSWDNHSREIKFYDKHAACLRKKKSKEEVEMSKGVGRLEISVKQAELRNTVGKIEASLGDVFDEALVYSLLQKHFTKIQPGPVLTTTERQAYETLSSMYSNTRTRNLMSYIHAVAEGKKKRYPRSTAALYDKYLKKAQVPPLFSKRELPALFIPNGEARQTGA